MRNNREAKRSDEKDHPDLKVVLQKVDALENSFKEKVIPLWEHFEYNNQNQQLKYA